MFKETHIHLPAVENSASSLWKLWINLERWWISVYLYYINKSSFKHLYKYDEDQLSEMPIYVIQNNRVC